MPGWFRRRGGRGFTPADLRAGSYFHGPPGGRDGWLLALSAPWVENVKLCHDLTALVPRRDGDWGRLLAATLSQSRTGTLVDWRSGVRAAREATTTSLEAIAAALAEAIRSGGGAQQAEELVGGPFVPERLALVADGGRIDQASARCWDVSVTTFLIRLGAAAGHLDAGAAMVEIDEQARRLPALGGWLDYGAALRRADRFVHPGSQPGPWAARLSGLLEPGMPWGDTAWAGPPPPPAR